MTFVLTTSFFQCKKALDTAQEEYEKQHQELMDAMPQFFEGRIDYFQPCFEALIKSQVNSKLYHGFIEY